MKLLFTLLQEGGTKEGADGTITILVYGAIIIVMYVFMLRPQIKRSKEARKFRESLGKGDKVITSGGIHGKVLELNENTIIISTEGGGKLKVEKNSVNLSPDEGMAPPKR